MADLAPEAIARLGSTVVRQTRIDERRYALELSLDRPPERVLDELVAQGARLVALNPVRDTLEDFFVKQVASDPGGSRFH